MDEIIAREVPEMKKGMSCSETTTLAMAHALKLPYTDETLRAIVVGLRGGIGTTRDEGTCGALTGAVVTMGLANPDNRIRTTRLSRLLYEDFKKEFGTVICGRLEPSPEHCLHCCLHATDCALRLLQDK